MSHNVEFFPQYNQLYFSLFQKVNIHFFKSYLKNVPAYIIRFLSNPLIEINGPNFYYLFRNYTPELCQYQIRNLLRLERVYAPLHAVRSDIQTILI